MSEKTHTAKDAKTSDASKAVERPQTYSSLDVDESDDSDWVIVQFPEPGEQNGGTYKPETDFEYRNEGNIDIKFRGKKHNILSWKYSIKRLTKT